MRVALILVVLTAHAVAQPVSYQTKLEVPLGQKPQIKITAARAVTDVTLELFADTGKKSVIKQGAMKQNQAVTLNIGEGAAGRLVWTGTISAHAPGEEPWSEPITLETVVRPELAVGYDAAHLDLDHKTLEITMSRPAGNADLTVIGEDGKQLDQTSVKFSSEKPGTWLKLTWSAPGTVMMLKLHVTSADAGVSDVQLIPWSVTIDHEDVNFATDSAEIAASEDDKLAASIEKIRAVVAKSEQFVKLKLYVAGHTDTVGPAAKNLKLSLARARAIAAYFRKAGIALPIAYAGYGETVLKVPTKDEVDEKANRRADYVLGPVGSSPPFKARATWSELK